MVFPEGLRVEFVDLSQKALLGQVLGHEQGLPFQPGGSSPPQAFRFLVNQRALEVALAGGAGMGLAWGFTDGAGIALRPLEKGQSSPGHPFPKLRRGFLGELQGSAGRLEVL